MQAGPKVFPSPVSGPVRKAAESYQSSPDTYDQDKKLTVCGCHSGAQNPEAMACRFLTDDRVPLADFAKTMREKGIGLLELVEGSAFKDALGYAFPAESHPQLVALLDDCRMAKQSNEITILNLVGMLCGQGAAARGPAMAPPPPSPSTSLASTTLTSPLTLTSTKHRYFAPTASPTRSSIASRSSAFSRRWPCCGT